PVAKEHARPDHRVEDDVVLPHEVRVLGFGVLPPVAPRIRRPPVRRPLDRGREVPDNSIEPDVDPLVRARLVAGNGYRHAPVEVPRDGSLLQLADEVQGETSDVLTPAVLALDPLRELVLERGKVEEEVLRSLEHRGRSVDPRPRIDEIRGIQLVPAVVAL